jgi:hypothetical protein
MKISKERYDEIKRAIGSGLSLQIPEELKEEGYHYRFFYDDNPNRLNQAKAMGYVPVKDKRGKAYTIYGGVGSRGKECMLHAMMISDEDKKELDDVRKSEKKAQQIASSFQGLKSEEVYTKKGVGDINTLNDIKQL